MRGGLRRFDGFQKLADEYRIGTVSGGALSLCALITTLVVFAIEIRDFLNPPLKQKFVLDSLRPVGPDGKTISAAYQQSLNVNFKITFPHVPCYLLHFDAIETLTNQPLPLQSSMITFTRLRDGAQAGKYTRHFFDVNTERCGSCYGMEEPRCCNSCSAVLDAFRKAFAKYPVLEDVKQCANVVKELKTMDGEGCSVDAVFKTVRIQGSFHIAPGMSSMVNETHYHDVKPFGVKWGSLNLTHTIDRFDLGGPDPGQLTGFTSVQEKAGYWRVVYMTNVMADDYTSVRYSVENSTTLFPGVSVDFDISPIVAENYYQRESLLQLFSKMVVSAGGTVFMFWILDATFYRANNDKKLAE